MKDFAEIAASLYKLTGKGVVLQWTSACQVVYETLKTAMVSSSILIIPTDEDMYILDTNASNYSIEAMLSQMQLGE